jgi:hypothetical protein
MFQSLRKIKRQYNFWTKVSNFNQCTGGLYVVLQSGAGTTVILVRIHLGSACVAGQRALRRHLAAADAHAMDY